MLATKPATAEYMRAEGLQKERHTWRWICDLQSMYHAVSSMKSSQEQISVNRQRTASAQRREDALRQESVCIAEQMAQKLHLCPNERLEVDVVGFTLGALVGDLRVLTK